MPGDVLAPWVAQGRAKLGAVVDSKGALLTHALVIYGISDPDARQEEADALVKAVSEQMTLLAQYPCIVGGDFNQSVNAMRDVCAVLSSGRYVDAIGLSERPRGPTTKFGATIDHLFVSGSMRLQTLGRCCGKLLRSQRGKDAKMVMSCTWRRFDAAIDARQVDVTEQLWSARWEAILKDHLEGQGHDVTRGMLGRAEPIHLADSECTHQQAKSPKEPLAPRQLRTSLARARTLSHCRCPT